MPTVIAPNPISLSTFENRPALGKRRVALPPRVAQQIELMIFGDVDANLAPMSLREAARHMGISERTARKYLRHSGGRAHYLACLALLRDSERARNLHTAIDIRDDPEMKKSAAGNRARIEAARFLEGEPEGDRRVNPGAVPVTPGICASQRQHAARP